MTLALCLCGLISVDAGKSLPIPKADTKASIDLSEQAFEAAFVSLEYNYLYKGKKMNEEVLREYMNLEKSRAKDLVIDRDWDSQGRIIKPSKKFKVSDDPFSEEEDDDYSHSTASVGVDGMQFDLEEVVVQAVLKLKITKIIKGSDKVGDVKRIDIYDSPYSGCPHIMSLGDIKKPQRYFLFIEKKPWRNKYNFGYQQVTPQKN